MGNRKRNASAAWPRWVLVLLALALVASACSSNDDDGDVGTEAPQPTAAAPTAEPADSEQEPDTAPAETEPDTSEPEATQAPAQTDEAEEPTAAPEPTEEPIVLTDSFRGVTSEAILIGHTHVDFEKLKTDLGLDLPYKGFGTSFLALVDWYNDQGGVLGRRLEAVSEAYWPLGTTAAEELCLRLTEDIQVFAVLGGYAGASTSGVNTCYTDLHETILVGGLPSQELAGAAGGLWLSGPISLERRTSALVSVLDQLDQIEDLNPIMVLATPGHPRQLLDSAVEQLRDAGADVPVVAEGTATGDEVATRAEIDVLVERGRVEGVKSVLLIGEDPFRDSQLWTLAPQWVYLVANGDRISTWEQETPDGLGPDTVVLTTRTFVDYPVDDPRIQQCIEVVEGATDAVVIPPDELEEGDPDYWSGMFNACRDLAIFIQVAKAAGPDLTNESWVAALGKVGDLSVPGFEFASLGPDKFDANDQQYLMEYDFDTKTFVELAGPLNIG